MIQWKNMVSHRDRQEADVLVEIIAVADYTDYLVPHANTPAQAELCYIAWNR